MARIAVVNSDAVMRRTVSRLLQTQGYEVMDFPDTAPVPASCDFQNLDLIIADTPMPAQDELLVQRLREKNAGSPVLVLNGDEDDRQARDLHSLGAQEVLSKPFESFQLLDAVQRCLPGSAGAGKRRIVQEAGLWEHFTVRDGLPDMKIECLFEDRCGVLWIGTHHRGVVCYERGEFHSFNRRDGLAGEGVFSIREDREGNLWFGTKQGLTRYDGKSLKSFCPNEPWGFLWGSCMDWEGGLWFGAERRPGLPPAVARWDGERLEMRYLSDSARPSGQSIHQIILDEEGRLWLGGDGLYYHNGTAFQCVIEPSKAFGQIYGMRFCQDKKVWLAAESGVYTCSTEISHRLEKISDDPWINAIIEWPCGTLWMTAYDGRLLRDDGTGLAEVRKVDDIFWMGFCLDRKDRLWIGTFGMGLYCYDRSRMQVYQDEKGSPKNPVLCITEDAAGVLWTGTRTGLVGYDKGGCCFPVEDRQLEGKEVTALLADRAGRLWIATRDGRVYTMEEGGVKLKAELPEPGGNSISGFAEDEKGRIWFASCFGEGFGYFEKDRVEFFRPQDGTAYPTWIGALAIDRDNSVWLGSAYPAAWNGLCRYDGGVFERVKGVSGSPILALYEDRKGSLWIGTSEGIIRWDGEGVERFTEKEGLPCSIVTAILQTADGKFWFGTEGGGVCCHDGQTFQVIQVNQNPAFNVIHALYQDRRGQIWFGTEGGLIQYRVRHARPEVVVSKVVADQMYEPAAEIRVPDTASRLSFCFSGSSPIDHSSCLVYRYRLSGQDPGWRQTGQRQVDYSGLKPGEYTFSVQAVDRDLNYSEVVRVRLLVTEDPRIEALHRALGDQLRGDFIGESPALTMVKAQIRDVARTDMTVLVFGETGTGKGVAARLLHRLSKRKDRPFIHVNCGALPRELVDSELFGHERGAFTGAVARKLGKFELADTGTIFLDEIGDLPLEAQTRLLRVLQDHCIERVGGTETIEVDVRVIAATNRDLAREVQEGGFRPDLYYRLNVFPIQIPLLQERRGDIPLLAEHFVREFAAHLQKEPPVITEACMQFLSNYEWPGNVRELEHALQRAVLLAKDGEIRKEHLVIWASVDAVLAGESAILPLKEYERRYLSKVLEHTHGVIQGEHGAAILLDIHPNTLRSRLEKLGLKGKKKEVPAE